jgi:cold shock CspA family protein
MRFEGELVEWNPETAFGTIRPAGGGEEVRVSQVAFPMDGDIPHLGEKLSFEIVTGRDGRKAAAQVRRLPPPKRDSAFIPLRKESRREPRGGRRPRKPRTLWMLVAALLVLGALGVAQWKAAQPKGAGLEGSAAAPVARR